MLLWTSGSQNCFSRHTAMASSLGGGSEWGQKLPDWCKEAVPTFTVTVTNLQSTEKSCGERYCRGKERETPSLRCRELIWSNWACLCRKNPWLTFWGTQLPQANRMRCQLLLVLSEPVGTSGPPARDDRLLIWQFINIFYNSWSLTYSLHPTEGSRS